MIGIFCRAEAARLSGLCFPNRYTIAQKRRRSLEF